MTEPDRLDSALQILRHTNPRDIEKNVKILCELAPDLAEELLEAVDVPLKVKRCQKSGRDFLCCDYNRDGDSWRSPWSNEFEPPLEDGVVPSDRIRKLEVEANEAFDIYRRLYYEGGTSSVYFWDIDEGFAGCVLIKKELSIPSKDPGCWDSIHVFEALDRARKAHYKLTSTIILDMSSKMDPGGTLDLSGNLVRQVEQDMPVENDGRHIVNIGKMVEAMELKMRNQIEEIYFGKVKDIASELWSREPLSKVKEEKAAHQSIIDSMKKD